MRLFKIDGGRVCKFFIPVICTAVLFIITTTILISSFRGYALDAEKLKIKELVETAWSILEAYDHQVQRSERSLEEAQQAALSTVSHLRYGNELKDYFWITDNMHPRLLIHPYLDLPYGYDLSQFTDVKGKPLFLESKKAVENGGAGYFSCYFQWKDDPNKIAEKISYVKSYTPWGWIIGTGVYLEEANAAVSNYAMKILAASIIALVLILLLSMYILRREAAMDSIRKEAVRALAENEERLQNITVVARDAIVEMGPDGRISFWNPAAEKLTGYSAAEAMGKNLHQLVVPPEYLDRHKKAFRVFQQTGQGPAIGKTTRWEIITKSGAGAPVELSLSTPLKVNDGWRTVGILRDISDRIDAERTLRESEFRFRTFFNSNPEGIVLLDFNSTILDVNNAFVRMSGYPLSEIVHHHFSKFLPESCHAFAEKAVQAIRSGRVRDDSPSELVFKKNDGTLLPIAVKGWLMVDENNTPVSLGAFVRDLTSEKHLAEEKTALEKQLRQAQKIEAVGTLAGGIAHDFNNILGGIIGYTELALVNESDSADKKTSTYLQHILTAGNRAKELVQQILRFSRRDESSMSNIHIKPVIEESIKLLRSTLPATITIEHHFKADLDRITGDITQIHQIIMNLCTNAYHAMRHQGGRLTVSLQNTVLKKPRAFMSLKILPGEYVQLSVSDTGHGIAPHIIERIFEPYFTTKKINEGSGLGLSVILGIVRKHHGLIGVTSKPGEGSRFDILFPLVHADLPEQRHLEEAMPPGKGERVLIVDDERFCRDVIKESLVRLGYQVNVQESSRKALETFRQTPQCFDLVVTDQTMPELTGVQLIEAVRQYNKTIPVILCTGFSDTVTEQSAKHYGIDKFIMKPVNIKELARAAQEALATRAA